MADIIQLDIVTPEKIVYSNLVEMVTAPGVLGEFGVLLGHAAFVTTLGTGEVSVKKENREFSFAVSGGFAEVLENKVTILAEAAEESGEIDVKRAEAAKTRAEDKLKGLGNENPQLREVEAALGRANNRIKVSARKA
jgi:F-type H+-transporting ATPase subunit epsilon